MYHHYNVLHPFRAIFLFPAIASIIHASHFPLQSSHFPSPHPPTTLAGILPIRRRDNWEGRLLHHQIPKAHNDVRINGQSFSCLPNPLFSLSLAQEEPFLFPFKRLLSPPHTHTTSTTITLIPTVLSLYAFIIHHHYPRILHFTHSPQAPPRDKVDRLITSFSYPAFVLILFFNLYYFSNSSSRRLSWRVAWRLPIFGTLCQPYKPPLFTSLVHFYTFNLVMLQQSSYLQLFLCLHHHPAKA